MKTRSLVAKLITVSVLAAATVGVASTAYANNHGSSGHTGGGGGGGGGAAHGPSHGGGVPSARPGRGAPAPVSRGAVGYYHPTPTVQRGAAPAAPVRGWNGSYPSHVGVDHRVYSPVYGRGAWGRPSGWRGYGYHAPYYSFVSVLPWYVGTTWWGGIPYYYADNTYYTYNDSVGQYEVVPPPGNADQGVAAAGPAPDPYVYPNAGQSEEQQQTDRYECHRWAVDQTGFDPTQADGGVAPSAVNEAADAYRRAESACLEGRGYTVR